MSLEDLEGLIDSLTGKFSAMASPLADVSGLIASVSSASIGSPAATFAWAAQKKRRTSACEGSNMRASLACPVLSYG